MPHAVQKSVVLVRSVRAMHKLASLYAASLVPSKKNQATIVALSGTLGSGKTTFVQGCFKALGVRRRATSPTFILMRRSRVRRGQFRWVYHIDAYRLTRAGDVRALEISEALKDPHSLFFVEWPERIAQLLPRGRRVRFAHGRTEGERTVRL